MKTVMGEIKPLDAFGPPFVRQMGRESDYDFLFVFIPKPDFYLSCYGHHYHSDSSCYTNGIENERWNEYKGKIFRNTGNAGSKFFLSALEAITQGCATEVSFFPNDSRILEDRGRPHDTDSYGLDGRVRWVSIVVHVENVRSPRRMSHAICSKLAKAMNKHKK